MAHWTAEELEQKLKANPDLKVAVITHVPKEETARRCLQGPSKYRARRTEYNGVLYASKKEAEFAKTLDLQKRSGEVVYWLRQVPFQLPKTVYRVDFLVVFPLCTLEIIIRYFDVKGYDTPVSKLKRRQVEALYPVKIEVV